MRLIGRFVHMIILGAILLATVLASFTDWLFMDLLVHRFYAANPAMWRPGTGAARIIVSQLIGTAASAALILLTAATKAAPLTLAAAFWAGAALPVTLQNLQWMRLHPAIAAG